AEPEEFPVPRRHGVDELRKLGVREAADSRAARAALGAVLDTIFVTFVRGGVSVSVEGVSHGSTSQKRFDMGDGMVSSTIPPGLASCRWGRAVASALAAGERTALGSAAELRSSSNIILRSRGRKYPSGPHSSYKTGGPFAAKGLEAVVPVTLAGPLLLGS